MSTRFVITLEKEERQAVDELARLNFRETREQLRYMIRKELERSGFLKIGHQKDQPAHEGDNQ